MYILLRKKNRMKFKILRIHLPRVAHFAEAKKQTQAGWKVYFENRKKFALKPKP